jgi:hypothetical protein
MMGRQQQQPEQLLYTFQLECHVHPTTCCATSTPFLI